MSEREQRDAWPANQGAIHGNVLGEDPLFPLATHTEQQRVMELLRTETGVVVQGPPGTGKTHTIANLVVQRPSCAMASMPSPLRMRQLTDHSCDRMRPLWWPNETRSGGASAASTGKSQSCARSRIATASTIRRQLELLHDERVAAGREPVGELPLMREVYCAPTRERAVELARPHLAGKYAVYADWGQDRVLPGRDSFRAGYADLAEDRFVVGSPEDCLAALLPWRNEFGVSHFVLRTDWAGMPIADARASLELLAREVAPVLRSSPAGTRPPSPERSPRRTSASSSPSATTPD